MGNKKRILNYITAAMIFVWTVGILTAATYIYQQGIGKTFEMALLSSVGTGCLLYTLASSRIEKLFRYDISEHMWRFYVIYMFSVLITGLLPLLPYTGWIFPALGLALALFSNSRIGIVSVGILISFAVMLSDAPIYVWMLYFVISVVCIILFERLDVKYETGLRMGIVMMLYTVCLFGMEIFLMEDTIELESFMIPCISLFANFILFSMTLRMYSVWVVHKQKDIYAIINDQEYDLIKEYKEDAELYYNAIHTAYFCEKIARKLNMDVDLAKAGGYYHKIIPEKAKKEEVSIQEICDRYQFPKEVGQLLVEYTDKSIPLHKREATVVLYADTMVSSIMYLFRKDSKMEPDYQAIAASIFKRKYESGVLRHSEISMNDLRVMEKIFAGEKLYYDFLR